MKSSGVSGRGTCYVPDTSQPVHKEGMHDNSSCASAANPSHPLFGDIPPRPTGREVRLSGLTRLHRENRQSSPVQSPEIGHILSGAIECGEEPRIAKVRADVNALWSGVLAEIGDLRTGQAWKAEVRRYIEDLNHGGLTPEQIAENNVLNLNLEEVQQVLHPGGYEAIPAGYPASAPVGTGTFTVWKEWSPRRTQPALPARPNVSKVMIDGAWNPSIVRWINQCDTIGIKPARMASGKPWGMTALQIRDIVRKERKRRADAKKLGPPGTHEATGASGAASMNTPGSSSEPPPRGDLQSIEKATPRLFVPNLGPVSQPYSTGATERPRIESTSRPAWLEKFKTSKGDFRFNPLKPDGKTYSVDVHKAIEYFYTHEGVKTAGELCKRIPQIQTSVAFRLLESLESRLAEATRISNIRDDVNARWSDILRPGVIVSKEMKTWYIGHLSDSGLSPTQIAANNRLDLDLSSVSTLLHARRKRATPLNTLLDRKSNATKLNDWQQAFQWPWKEGEVFAIPNGDDFAYFSVTRLRFSNEPVLPNDFRALPA